MDRSQITIDRVKRSASHRRLLWRHRDAASWTGIIEDIERLAPAEVGIDVFDTVLSRAVLGDSAMESLVARRVIAAGLWRGTLASYLQARAEAARQDPSAHLHAWLTAMMAVGLSSADDALEVELEAESELLRPVPGAQAALVRLRQGRQLTFVSDMHHDGSAVRAILQHHELIESGDRLVVSCEHDASKSDGTLFELAFSDEHLGNSGVAFIGNNPWSDVTQAAASGAAPVPAMSANPTRYESVMANNASSAGPVIAAAARTHRLTSIERGDPDPIAIGGSQVAGQVMTAFVLWVRQQCESSNINHLEFLARDGELPLRVAQAMPNDHWSNFSLNYLHCGRRAWSLAAAPLVGVEKWIGHGTGDSEAFLLHSAGHIPFRSVLARCRLQLEDLPQTHPLRNTDPQQALGTGDAVQSWADVLQSGSLNALIEKRAAEPLNLILQSLRQRKLPSESIALIDVGWRGLHAMFTGTIIREVTGHEPLHLHFGGDEVLPEIDKIIQIRRFAFDDSVRPHPIGEPVSCLETFLASGKARLLGYEHSKDDSVCEVFEDASSPVDTDSLRRLWSGAIDMAKFLPSRHDMDYWCDCSQDLDEEARKILTLFWAKPSKSEAVALSGLRFEGDDAGDSIGRVVRPYSPAEVFGRAIIPRQWRHGSLVATPAPFQSFMRLYFVAKDVTQARRG